MHQGHTSHQILHFPEFIPYLHGILHMVDIEHYQSVHMTVFQFALTFLLGLVLIKEIATEHIGRQFLFQFICPCQKFLLITLGSKFRLGLLVLQFPWSSEQKLLIVRILEPGMDGSSALSFPGSSHSLFHGPAHVDVPRGLLASHFFPEDVSAAFHGRRLLHILQITKHGLQRLNVRYIEDVLMAIVVIAPYALFPETFHDIRLVLIILCLTVL